MVGLGYIGLPTAATIASRGIEVIGVDTNPAVVRKLNEGKAHFSEPDLDILLEASVSTGRLRAMEEPVPADVFVIAVPTPFHSDKSADLSCVRLAARSVARVLDRGNLIILESTVPVGTTNQLCRWIADERPDLAPPIDGQPGDFHVAYCPERILPGRMVFELVENDRIIGGMSKTCGERAAELYRLFVRGALLQTKASLAELVKLTENAFRDVNIAFANELSILCDHLHLDVWEAIALANRHPRVNILNPGAGVGGHCIAVDPWFLISACPERTPLMAAARRVNDGKPEFILAQLRKQMERFKRPIVACLGLAYKPNVDDLRESPALHIAQALAHDKIDLLVVEPHIERLPEKLDLPNVRKVSLEEAVGQADIIALLVGHQAFSDVPRGVRLGKVVLDAAGLWQT